MSSERVSDVAEFGAFVLLGVFVWIVWWPAVFLVGAVYLFLLSLSVGRSDESSEARSRP